jgi:hypothetical protein
MRERRNDPRYSVRQDVLVWDRHHIRTGSHSATIVDLSVHGLQLESAERFTDGSGIVIDFKGTIICGTVQYSRTKERQFATGLRIQDVLDPIQEQSVGRSDHSGVSV